MAISIGNISLKLVADASQFINGLNKAAKGVEEFQSMVDGAMAKMNPIGSFKGLLATGGIGAMLGESLKLSANAESMSTQFEVMTGNAAKAKELMADIRKFAVETPFQTEELAKAGKQLLASGFAVDEVMTKLRQLGDVSAGTGQDMAEMARIFGQVRATGRLMGQDAMQLAQRNIPLYNLISQKLGKTELEVKKMGEEGLLTFSMVEGALESMTSKGGRFFGMTERLSTTLSGLASTARDTLTLMLTDIGDKLVSNLKLKEALANVTGFATAIKDPIVGGVTAAVESFKEWGTTLAKLGGTVLVFTAGLKAMTATLAVARAVQAGWATLTLGGGLLMAGGVAAAFTLASGAVNQFTTAIDGNATSLSAHSAAMQQELSILGQMGSIASSWGDGFAKWLVGDFGGETTRARSLDAQVAKRQEALKKLEGQNKSAIDTFKKQRDEMSQVLATFMREQTTNISGLQLPGSSSKLWDAALKVGTIGGKGLQDFAFAAANKAKFAPDLDLNQLSLTIMRMNDLKDAEVNAASQQAGFTEGFERILNQAIPTIGVFDEIETRIKNLQDAARDGRMNLLQYAAGYTQLRLKMDDLKASKAAEIFQATRAPLEQFQAQMETFTDVKFKDQITKARAVAAEWKKATDSLHLSIEAPGAVLQGSQEAFASRVKAINQSRVDQFKKDPAAVIEALKQQQAQADREAQRLLEDIKDLLRDKKVANF